MRSNLRIAVCRRGKPGRRANSFSANVATAAVCLSALASPTLADTPPIKIELNKLEQQEQNCRAYVVVTNGGQTAYKAMKLDLVMFRTDGVIGKRFAIDLAPIKPEKRTVKLFTLEGTPCDQVGSLLVNDIMECSTDAGAVDNCLAQISTSSLSNVQLSK